MPDVTLLMLFVFAVAFLGSFCALALDRWIQERARWRWPKRGKMPTPRRFP